MSGAIPLGPLYIFIAWTHKPLPLLATICLKVLSTKTVFIHKPRYVFCSVHVNCPAHPRHLHVFPELHIFTSSASLSIGRRHKRNILF